ncbi:SAM-dependent methyltransferase [uncultured Clostridium sp.]|uniref:TRM11 family SAM-dependent methyltransferase n=1 Tax=uncultured Clostridium sp. TaxID=59620 RepID=UPI0026068B41|nr:SAM-dependent methyltransferase [uncultured Clostridium sp.]
MSNRNEKYLYIVNYPKFEEELCMMEMREVFNKKPENKVFTSNIEFNQSSSPFIKNRLDIIYEEDSLESILENIKREKLSFEKFKVEYLKLEEGNVPYNERLHAVREIGFVITGFPDIHNPEISIGVTRYNGKWLLGINKRNDYEWHMHDKKPCSYSNSLSTRVAKSIVNIANKGDLDVKIIDPCCGVGTTLIEGLSIGADICGCEINPQIACNAKRNLEFFGLEQRVTKGSMHDLKEKFQVSIIDIPYGLFTKTTEQEQSDIIKTARRISDKMIIITFEDMSKMIDEAGFKIIDTCKVCKGQFIRYVSICI